MLGELYRRDSDVPSTSSSPWDQGPQGFVRTRRWTKKTRVGHHKGSGPFIPTVTTSTIVMVLSFCLGSYTWVLYCPLPGVSSRFGSPSDSGPVGE